MSCHSFDPTIATKINKSLESKTNGFEGCKNCDFAGFYGAIYSPEQFCGDCELKYYPERFNGCRFCGRAGKNRSVCWTCELGVNDWVFNLFYNKNKASKTTLSLFVQSKDETNNKELWYIIQKVVFNIVEHRPDLIIPVSINERWNCTYNWNGFRINNGTCIQLDPFKLKKFIDIRDLTAHNSCEVINRELQKLGIFINDAIQIHDEVHVPNNSS